MNSKILFSLLGLFYGMSRGAFRGVSFFFVNLICGRASLVFSFVNPRSKTLRLGNFDTVVQFHNQNKVIRKRTFNFIGFKL